MVFVSFADSLVVPVRGCRFVSGDGSTALTVCQDYLPVQHKFPLKPVQWRRGELLIMAELKVSRCETLSAIRLVCAQTLLISQNRGANCDTTFNSVSSDPGCIWTILPLSS